MRKHILFVGVNYLKLSFLLIWMLALANCNFQSKQNVAMYQKESELLNALRDNLFTQKEWIKVHAAEFLLWSGHPEGVKEEFLEEERLFAGKHPYRIGIWRVLAQAELEQTQRNSWIEKIRNAYLDEFGQDRVHAIETLAKLELSPFSKETKSEDILPDVLDSFSVYKLWSYAYTSEESYLESKDLLLKYACDVRQSMQIRATAAYALKKMGKLDEISWNQLVKSSLSESVEVYLQAELLSACVMTACNDVIHTSLYKEVFKELIGLIDKGDHAVLIKVLDALSEKGNFENRDIISSIFDKMKTLQDEKFADVLSSYAYAAIEIRKRERIVNTFN